MIRILFLLLFSVHFMAVAQNSENTDILLGKPEWAVSTPGSEFKIRGKSCTDSSGNTFVTGSFLKSVSGIDGKVLTSKISEHSYFVSMYNKDGKLQWIQIHEGKSNGTAITAEKGFVYVTGIVQTNHRFTSSDPTSSDSVKLTPELSGGAAFVARYDYKGKLQWVRLVDKYKDLATTGISVEPSNGYIYVTGTWRESYLNGHENTAAVLLKFSRGGTLQASILSGGDNEEKSGGVTYGYNGYYLTGSYQYLTQFSGITVKGESERSMFLVKYDYAHTIQWIVSSEGKAIVSGKEVTHDSKGNAYVLGNFQGTLVFSGQKETQKQIRSVGIEDVFLAKFDLQGKLLWVQTIGGQSTESATSVVTGPDDKIYVCGQSSMGAAFSTAGTDVKKFTGASIGGTDYFISCYDPEGVLLWMKANIQPGLEYCNGIGADKKGNVYLLVNETSLQKYSLKSLQNPGIKTPTTSEIRKPEVPDYRDCKCAEGTTRNIGLAQPLKDQIDYKTFTAMTGFKMKPGRINAYEYVYCADLRRYTNKGTTEISTNLISIPFFRLNVSEAVSLDLTPCYDGRPAELPASFTKTQQILEYLPNFNINTFKGTPREYYDIFIKSFNFAESSLLSKAVFDFDENTVAKEFIEKINKKYGTKIQPDKTKKKETIDDMVDKLHRKNINTYDLIYDELIAPIVKQPTGLNPAIESRFTTLFNVGPISQRTWDKIIYPQYKTTLDVSKIGILLPITILRRWDYFKNEAMKDTAGNFLFAKTVVEVGKLEYSSEDKIKVYNKLKTCFTLSEIPNTGILIDFQESIVDLSEERETRLDHSAHPFHLIRKVNTQGDTLYSADTLVKKFTGLLINEASFKIPVKGKLANLKGRDVLINNYFISGVMTLSLQSYTNNTYSWEQNGEKFSMTEKELKEIFSKKGMQHKVVFRKEKNDTQENQWLTIYFTFIPPAN